MKTNRVTLACLLCLAGLAVGACPGAMTMSGAICGNGVVEAGEQCDDGNGVNTDGCKNNCTLPSCGDGLVSNGEQCDPPDGTTCGPTCQRIGGAICGNGMLEGTEQCDD